MNQMNDPCGVLVLHKTAGMTSHDAVNKIRRLYGTKQVGHTGTLDPMATGVLVVLIGRAAKFAEFLVSDGKAYTAVMRLGVTSDTGDLTGNLTETGAVIPDEAAVRDACAKFVGDIVQVPPMYSALKVNGRKLVDLARKGITVEREGRTVTVNSLSVTKLSDVDYELAVDCSKGTYIRTLCEDIGAELGCGALMASLRRDRSGVFSLDGAPALDELEAMPIEERVGLLVGVEELFADLYGVVLPEFFAHLAHCGCEVYSKKISGCEVVMPVSSAENPAGAPDVPAVSGNVRLCDAGLPLGTLVRLYDADGFFALAELREFEDGTAFKPVKQYRV